MRILIDGMNLAMAEGTGVATYARNLSYCIKQNGHHLSVLYGRGVPAYRDPLLREAAFFDDHERQRNGFDYVVDVLRSLLSYRPAEVPRTGQVLRSHIAGRLPEADEFLNSAHLFFKAAAKFEHLRGVATVRMDAPVDIAHWTYPIPLRMPGAKNIYTFHDLVPIKLPYATLDVKNRYLAMLRRLARGADHIVTVSEASRRDIVETLGVDPARVTNTYQSARIPAEMLADDDAQLEIDLRAINPDRAADRSVQTVRRDEFFLYVGAIEPKKNLVRVIEGYLASGSSRPLVVVGKKAWQYKREMRLIKAAGRRIVYLDYVPFGQVITLMRAARGLIFASLYEGFGLPVLEAFQCGAPVITANASSTAEIAGEAALLVDPYDIRDIRDAIRRLDAPGAEALREDLRARGRARAAAFSQDAIAARLEALYRDVAAG